MKRIKEKWQESMAAFLELPPAGKLAAVVPYLAVMLVFARLAELFRLCEGSMARAMRNLEYLYCTLPRFTISDLAFGIVAGWLTIRYIKWDQRMHRKNTKKGEEYGSSRWGTGEDIRPFIDPDPFYNLILSKTEFLSMKSRMPKFKLNRNKHVVVYGGSGAGKTYGIVKPNMMQLHSSYVVTDPKGTLLPETGNLFAQKGYRIKVLDTIDFENSMHYNPFHYIKKPKDILTFATALQKNLKPEDAGTPPDPFFDQAALLWLQSVIGLLWYEAPPEEQNMDTLLEILEEDKTSEEDEDFQNAVDMVFEELEKKDPRHFAVKQRKKYKMAAGKTAKSVLITLGASLAPFDIPEVREMFRYDELEFDTYGDPGQKSILYVIIPDTDSSFNFIPALLFTQMFQVLCYKADKVYGGKLKTPVQFILDEFPNLGKIPNFKILIATVRSRLISCILMLQTQSQLKDNYKDAAETITGNCDSAIFLGGSEKSTLKDLEEVLGEETIDLYNESRTYGASDSSGINYNKTGRKLKNMFELATMDRDKCIVRISGLPPFFSDKYDTTKHPNYKYLADYDEKNIFDFQKYRKKQKEAENVGRIRFHKEDSYAVYIGGN